MDFIDSFDLHWDISAFDDGDDDIKNISFELEGLSIDLSPIENEEEEWLNDTMIMDTSEQNLPVQDPIPNGFCIKLSSFLSESLNNINKYISQYLASKGSLKNLEDYFFLLTAQRPLKPSLKARKQIGASKFAIELFLIMKKNNKGIFLLDFVISKKSMLPWDYLSTHIKTVGKKEVCLAIGTRTRICNLIEKIMTRNHNKFHDSVNISQSLNELLLFSFKFPNEESLCMMFFIYVHRNNTRSNTFLGKVRRYLKINEDDFLEMKNGSKNAIKNLNNTSTSNNSLIH